MRFKHFLILVFVILPLSVRAQSSASKFKGRPAKVKKAEQPAQEMSLGERQKAFHAILDKQTTPEAKIKKAEEIAVDKKSKFRVDALNYLIDQKSASSTPVIASLVSDPDLKEFAIYGVGELEIRAATPAVIHALKDDSRNIRGNAFRTMQRLYPREFNFPYHYDDAPNTRKAVIADIEDWWQRNRTAYQNRAVEHKTPAEKEEADRMWQTYARSYLDRP